MCISVTSYNRLPHNTNFTTLHNSVTHAADPVYLPIDTDRLNPQGSWKTNQILQDYERFQSHFRSPVLSSNESLQDTSERPVNIGCACARDVFWISSFTCWTFLEQTTRTCDMMVRCTIQDQHQQTSLPSLHTVF